MKPKFLCQAHRNQLFSDPEQADYFWHEWMSRGSKLYDELTFEKATPFLGCAYELSEHFLGLDWPDIETAISRFTYSSICLTQALAQTGKLKESRIISEYSDERLNDAITFNNSIKEQQKTQQHMHRCKHSLNHRGDSSYWINRDLAKSATHQLIKPQLQ